MSPFEWALALLVTAAAATVQGVVGIGFSMIAVPILSLIDPQLAPVPQLFITMPLTLAMTFRERQGIDVGGIGWIIVGRVPGAAVGLFLLAMATGVALDLMIATVVLLAVAILASGYRVRRNHIAEFGAGVFSGISGLIASIGGPPLALLYSGEAGEISRPSLSAVFSVGLAITIAVRSVAGYVTLNDLKVALVLFPALLAGYLVSGTVKNRIDARQLRIAVLGLCTLAALGLILRALT